MQLQTPPLQLALSAAKRLRESRYVSPLLWTVAIASFAWLIGKTARSPLALGDLHVYWAAAQAYVHHQAPYVHDFHSVDPFVYPPSALPLLAPLATAPYDTVRTAFLVLESLSIAVAGAMSLAAGGITWRSRAGAFALLGISLFEPIRGTLWLGQIDGFLLLGEAAALMFMCRGRWSLAAAFFGLTLALKPVLVPLLLVFLLWRKWRATLVAVAIPAALLVIGIATTVDWQLYVIGVIPFKTQIEPAAPSIINVSLNGLTGLIGLPPTVTLLSRLVVGAAAAAGIAAVYLLRRNMTEWVRIIEIATLLLLALFLCAPFTRSPYALFLAAPFLALSGVASSALRTWPAWVGLYCVGSPDLELLQRVSWTGSRLRLTFGLLLLLAAFLVPLAARWQAQQQLLDSHQIFRRPQRRSANG